LGEFSPNLVTLPEKRNVSNLSKAEKDRSPSKAFDKLVNVTDQMKINEDQNQRAAASSA
jgi:hypothetical protein